MAQPETNSSRNQVPRKERFVGSGPCVVSVKETELARLKAHIKTSMIPDRKKPGNHEEKKRQTMQQIAVAIGDTIEISFHPIRYGYYDRDARNSVILNIGSSRRKIPKAVFTSVLNVLFPLDDLTSNAGHENRARAKYALDAGASVVLRHTKPLTGNEKTQSV